MQYNRWCVGHRLPCMTDATHAPHACNQKTYACGCIPCWMHVCTDIRCDHAASTPAPAPAPVHAGLWACTCQHESCREQFSAAMQDICEEYRPGQLMLEVFNNITERIEGCLQTMRYLCEGVGCSTSQLAESQTQLLMYTGVLAILGSRPSFVCTPLTH